MVDFVVVGADRVTLDGSTANKIGTYALSVLAKHHGIPFYVSCPESTIDFNKLTGSEIEIEHRPIDELMNIMGVSIAPNSESRISTAKTGMDRDPGFVITEPR